jgi:AraC family transcriptional regulator
VKVQTKQSAETQQTRQEAKAMKVQLRFPESVTEPRLWLSPDLGLALILRPGFIEWGSRRSAVKRIDYAPGDLGLCTHQDGKWVGQMNVSALQITISSAALMATCDDANTELKFHHYRKFTDPRLGALAAVVNEERIAGFPNGRLFLDSVEQAIAVAILNGHAVSRRRILRTYRGGLGAARLRKIKELVHSRMDGDLSLDEMAQCANLSRAHFARMFRKSTGETPHQFVLRQRVERAKSMLRVPAGRVLDVAVACGFKTQQHFAQVFRNVCGVSPREYRQDFGVIE